MKQHIYPGEDLREHEMTETCWCNPCVDPEDDIVIHISMAQRELFETSEWRVS